MNVRFQWPDGIRLYDFHQGVDERSSIFYARVIIGGAESGFLSFVGFGSSESPQVAIDAAIADAREHGRGIILDLLGKAEEKLAQTKEKP